MDAGDHTKIQAPAAGHEAVHVCHRCGWPFPNSHPSARHRRAHKKVCGTLQGYKLVDSNDSDDDTHSDEDHKTPSPRVLERSINEKGSGGTGSNRSEYELFTDAATEFSDSSGFSPGVEERFVDARKSTSSMERIAIDDFSSSQSVKDGAIADIIQQSSISADSHQMKNHEVPDCTTDQLQSTLQYQNDMPSIVPMANFVAGPTAEELVISNDSNSPSSDSYPIKYEKLADNTSHESEAKPGETVTESLLEVIGQDKHSGCNQEVKLDSVSQDIMTEHSTTEMNEIAHKLETKEPEAMSDDEVSQSKKERTERLNPKKSSDFYAEISSIERSDYSSDTSQINVIAAQATDSTSSSYIVKGGDRKGVNEIVHVLSVPDDISIVAHPEVMLEGFKDHKGVKLPQPLSSCERIDDKEDNLQSPLCKENSLNFQSRQSSEDSEVNCSIMPVLEDKLDDGNSKSALKEVSFEGEVSLPEEVKVTIDENKQSDEVGVPQYAATVGMIKSHTVSFTKEVMPHNIFKGSLPMTFPDSATEVVSDVNFMESSMSAKVNEETSSVNLAEAGNYEKGTNENRDTTGTENPEGVTEDNTENTAKALGFSSNISEFQVNSITNLSNGNSSAGDQDHCKSEKCDISENSISGELVEENISIDTKSVPDCASNLHESQVATEDVLDGSIDKVLGIGHIHLGTVSDSSIVGTVVPNIQEGTEDQINGKKSVQVERIVGVSLQSQHGNDVEIFHKDSEYPILKEPIVSPLSYDAVEENDLIEIGEGTSTIGSETLQVEGDSTPAKQHFAAADISIDSCSLTDSLDAHWGSVSVLSTQSDVPTIIDAENLRSTDSLAPAAENANLRKLKGSDKSLLTLVETGKKVDGSENQGNAQHSLTNVVNESPGRKKNEEIIAKVTNWSSGKQHIPLKSLISETSLETKPKEAEKDDSAAAKGDGAQAAATVNSILGTESPAAQATTQKEWNSPARYPSDIKREKRKVRGRPLWAPFVCCYSVN